MKIANAGNLPTRLLLLSILVLLSLSCKHNPTGPIDDRPLLTSSSYHNLILKLTDYDVVHITNATGLDLRSPSVVRVGVGSKDSMNFKQLLSMTSTYDPNAHAFIVHFDYTATMDSSKIQAPLTIRYYAADSSYIDADTSVNLVQFPYQSATVSVTSAVFSYNEIFQDIDRVGDRLYFHGLGPDGLHVYDLNSRHPSDLYDYTSGDHIAADSAFVYCDVGHDHIDRYNVSNGTVDFSFLSFAPEGVWGLALSGQQLYVLVNNQWNGLSLRIFALDGSRIDSIPYPKATYFITLYDSIVYSVDWWSAFPDQISRFDLRTKTFLTNLIAPAKSLQGIKVFGNQMYYCDYNKDYVGNMPIADLLPVQNSPTHTSSSRHYGRAPNKSLKLTE